MEGEEEEAPEVGTEAAEEVAADKDAVTDTTAAVIPPNKVSVPAWAHTCSTAALREQQIR